MLHFVSLCVLFSRLGSQTFTGEGLVCSVLPSLLVCRYEYWGYSLFKLGASSAFSLPLGFIGLPEDYALLLLVYGALLLVGQ